MEHSTWMFTLELPMIFNSDKATSPMRRMQAATILMSGTMEAVGGIIKMLVMTTKESVFQTTQMFPLIMNGTIPPGISMSSTTCHPT
jgi:hypothetical protein